MRLWKARGLRAAAVRQGAAAGLSALALLLICPVAGAEEFGVAPGSFAAGSLQGNGTGSLDQGASPDTQAGDHPFAAGTSFAWNTHAGAGGNLLPDGGATKDIVVKLPPGFIGDPHATPQCSVATLTTEGACPSDTAIGVLRVSYDINLGGGSTRATVTFYPVYNMVPGRGEPALFAFYNTNPPIPIFFHLHLDASREYAVTATVSKITGLGMPISTELVIWGVPAESSHNIYRGFGNGNKDGCLNFSGGSTGSCASDAPLRPLLTDPVACTGQPLQTGLAIDSWEQPGTFGSEGAPEFGDPAWKTALAESPPLGGCGSLEFGGVKAPVSFSLQPATSAADTPSGYEAKLKLPYNDNPGGFANPTLRDIEVTLPEGVVVNPSAANGLAACSTSQIGLATAIGARPVRFDGQPAQCPDASRIGSVEVTTPLIDHTLHGSVFLARQNENPFDSLLAIYLVLEDPETGIIVKLAGRVQADPLTGRLATTFRENPQLPFTELTLRLFGGATASLLTPQTCGSKTTRSVLTPSSAPETPAVTTTDSFAVQAGARGGTCPASEADEPNSPSFEAGSVHTGAGAYSPFTLKLAREDGTQRFGGIDLTLPPGLLGKLAGIQQCSPAQIAQAEARSHPGEGAIEQASPSCPASSQLGSVNVAAGAGPHPVNVQGRVYLAGPWQDAPFSLVVITPAVAGPFDLGVVVVRAGLHIDRSTAQVTVKTGPIPSMLEGIPLDVRSIAVEVDRPGFTLNPTSCREMSLTGDETSTVGQAVPLSDRFQVGGCAGLAFKPLFTASTSAKTSRRKGASLNVKIVYPAGEEANIAKAKVRLPIPLPSRLSTLQKACTEAQFAQNPAGCPAASVVGTAKAVTPILASPLEGPAYFVSHGGAKFPELIMVLQGEGVTIQLAGETFIREGVTTSTFDQVPDAPVSSFTLNLPTGEDSALAAPGGHLCRDRLIMPTTLTAQNGMVLRQNTRIHVQGCPDRLQVVSHKLRHRTLTLRVAVPAAGKLRAKGKGLAAKTRTATGAETLTLKLKERGRPTPKTKIALAFTPSSGKTRKQLKTNITIKHKH